MRPPTDPDVRSLDRASIGEALLLRHVLFDRVRDRLRAGGIGEGDTVVVKDDAGAALLLETAAGAELRIDRDDARFVEVARHGGLRRRYGMRPIRLDG